MMNNVQIGSTDALMRARKLCDEYYLPESLKTQTVLWQAECFGSNCGYSREALKQDLLNRFEHNLGTDSISSIKALSALFSIYGKVRMALYLLI